ncbi:MAG: lipopolysaccharide heptosyltransferase family protein [Proteobacteria bacterium]|nr:lipopolysaccharide heptosyltransferase family protein [Pseudomonadota bacterium]
MPTKDPSRFFDETSNVRRVLLLDLGFLGDSIHLLPALWTLRQAYPEAELHVMVAEHVTRVMEVAPWVDKVWGYPRYPKGPKWYQDLGRIRQLRDAKFDVVINLNGSDRSSILTGLSGARWRLGRVPQDGGPSFWPLMFTHTIEVPYHTKLIAIQRWECLKLAGFPGEKPEMPIEIPAPSMTSMIEKAGGDGGWIHVSPFTTANYRELPTHQLSKVLGEIHRLNPSSKIILSCAPDHREQQKMGVLISQLDFSPWRVFPGSLDLMELTALIQKSRLHLGGDTGSLHIAWMCGTPSVIWFRHFDGLPDWRPMGDSIRSFVGDQDEAGIRGISNVEILEAVEALLDKKRGELVGKE